MRRPWSRTDPDRQHADRRYEDTRGHLRVLLHELQATLDRIEDKRRRGMPGAG